MHHLFNITWENDANHLGNLGPFARALVAIQNGWAEKQKHDKLPHGKLEHRPWEGIYHPEGYFSQSLLLFRATVMRQEWIDDWKQMSMAATALGAPDFIRLQGFVLAFETMNVALRYYKPTNEEWLPVLFVISMKNYHGLNGFRLNRP